MKNKFISNTKYLYSYKILKPLEFEQFYMFGLFKGSSLDITHGFIHLCGNPTQTINTIGKFYNYESIMIVKFPNDKLINLKFEQNKPGGEFYPHLYSHLTIDQVNDVYSLEFNKNNIDAYKKRLSLLNKIIK